jgi:ATP-dependent Clp protease ATP-binding subunit ClpA
MGPFDRFNDRAKRVLALAQDEAIRFNHNYIGPEHLVLGLVREGEGVAARALDSLGIELGKVRSAVEFIVGRGDATTSPSEITLAPRTKRIIELAIDEARKLGHSHVGTEHLLLGIVREGESVASGILESLGVSLEKVRHQVIATIGQGPTEGGRASGTVGAPVVAASQSIDFADRLDSTGRKALGRAFWEAGRANAARIEPHHVLLGLLWQRDAWTRSVLGQLGVNHDTLFTRIDELAPPSTGPRPAGFEEQAALRDLLARACELAAERNSYTIRAGDLLLAIAYADGPAINALASFGVTTLKLREVLEKMSG